MISVVTCSKSPENLERFRANVEETVGAPFEIVPIDNSQGGYTIFSAYNEGASLAKGEIICFSHEDVLFHDKGWGRVAEAHFKADASLGMLGFYGSDVILPSVDWRDCLGRISSHCVQHVRTKEKDSREFIIPLIDRRSPSRDRLSEVQVLDGFCFFIPAAVMRRLSFDESFPGGFHQYDTDISLQVRAAGYRVCVCHDIFPEHFSPGRFTRSYYDALQHLFKKWDRHLPESIRSGESGSLRRKASEAAADKLMEVGIRRKHSCGEELTQEEKEAVHDSVLFYHHVHNKTAPSADEAVSQIKESRRRDAITGFEAFYLTAKAYRYQLLRRLHKGRRSEKYLIF